MPRKHAFRRLCMALACLAAAAASSAQETARPASGAPASVPAYRQANTVAVLTVHGVINGVTLRSLERRVRLALDEGADAIVLDLDTPGGEVTATRDITHLIRTECPGNTVAWINPNAYSAGTIIAIACREIIVAPDAAFGDAAPIQPTRPMPQAERAKMEAPLLIEVTDSARRNHYDENLVKAFVSVGVELWLIENVETGQRVFVDRQEFIEAIGDDPPRELTPLAPPAHLQTIGPVSPWFEKLGEVEGGEPPDPEELARRIEAEQDLPPSRARLTRADRGKWRPVKQVVSNDALLVVKPNTAIEYGLATRLVANDEQLKAYFGAQTIRRYDRSWSEGLVRFLTNPIVRGVLLVIFVVCLLIELAAPGLGVFGATAAVSLLIVIGAPWLAGMAQWWELVLIAVGIVLVGVELFIIPGFGLAGVGGVACLLVGLVGTFISGDLRTGSGQKELAAGIAATLTAMTAGGIAAFLLFRQIENVPLIGRFVLKTELGSAEDGGTPGLLESIGETRHPLEPGACGLAETDLRPAGRASFDGRMVEVKSVGAYIDRGTPVRVVSVGEFAIEVERAS